MDDNELRKMLIEAGHEPEEIDGLLSVYAGLGDIPCPGPGQELSDGFYAMLDAEKARLEAEGRERDAADRAPGSVHWKSLLGMIFGGRPAAVLARAAVAVLLVAAGWTSARLAAPGTGVSGEYEEKLAFMSSEMAEMKKMMMFSMLNRDSASERLTAVQYLGNLAPGDEQVTTALLEVFERDSNVNVRLATLEALVTAGDDPRVTEALLRNIGSQKSPLVQLALVDAMIQKGEERSLGHFVHLLERDDLRPMVRTRVGEVVRFFS